MTDWNKVGRWLGLGSSSLIGAVVAVLGDLIQKEAASAVLKVSSVAHDYLNLPAPPIVWALILVALGVGIGCASQPNTYLGALYAGASVLALMMTPVPYKPPPAPPTGGLAAGLGQPGAAKNLLAADFRSGIIILTATSDSLELSVNLQAPKEGPRATALVTGREARRDLAPNVYEYRAALVPGGTTTHRLAFKPHRESTPSTYTVRVEADGYEISTVEQNILPGSERVDFTIILKPSRQPLWMQRLFKVPVK